MFDNEYDKKYFDENLIDIMSKYTLNLSGDIKLVPTEIEKKFGGGLRIFYYKIPKNIPIKKILKKEIQLYGKKFIVSENDKGIFLEEKIEIYYDYESSWINSMQMWRTTTAVNNSYISTPF